MTEKTDAPEARSAAVFPVRSHVRSIILLVAMCCLLVGIALGAILRGIAIARVETPSETAAAAVAPDSLPGDNRLTMSNGPSAPDSMSAVFARVASLVEPSVVHIKVVLGDERQGFGRRGTGSGVIVTQSGYIITNQHVAGEASKLTVKLAEITVDGRTLRVFETSDPNLLLVKEKKGPIHEDYAIERDEGVVADLKLYAQMP